MIIYKNNLIITPIKTGTVSTRKLFYRCLDAVLLDDKWQQDRIKWHSIDHSAIRIKDKKVWLLVRNPYERLLSIYHYFIDLNTRSIFAQNYERDILWGNVHTFEDFLENYIVYRQMMFSDSTLNVLAHSEQNMNWHILVDLKTLYFESQATGYIKIESLSEELKQLGVRLNEECLFQSQKPENVGTYRTENKSWREYFNTPSIIRTANIICAEDAKKFNYPILKGI